MEHGGAFGITKFQRSVHPLTLIHLTWRILSIVGQFCVGALPYVLFDGYPRPDTLGKG
ncbi:hypothetical protein L209DRAFT_754904 [Thermothelomyces heterothallicus CBS 203.75]